MRHTLTPVPRPLVLGALLLAATGCRADLDIQSPAVGAMLVGDEAVDVIVTGVKGSVTIEAMTGDRGEDVTAASGQARRFVPSHDGLGFVAVETTGSPKAFAIRSWHQGTFLEPNTVQRSIATGRLDQPLLDSVADLVARSLMTSDLAVYAEQPVNLEAPVGVVTMDVASAGADIIDIDVEVDDAGLLHMNAYLRDVTVLYQADHSSLSWLMDYGTEAEPIYGRGTFDTVDIAGLINLPAVLCDPDPAVPCAAGSFLQQVTVTPSEVVMDDPNCEFLWGWLDLCGVVSGYFEEQLPPPLADAAEATAAHALRHLIQAMDPQLEVQFDNPIEKDLTLLDLRTEDNAVVLEYGGVVAALEPTVARADQGVLERSMTTPNGGGICVGRPAVNALSFASWDAGNLRDLVFDTDELIGFGMPDAFPWSDIRSSTLESVLPPLLEFREGSAWLDVGGVRAVVDAGAWGEAILWSAVQVPVRVGVNDEGGITLEFNPSADGSRDIRLLGVGFEEAHDLLDRSAAVEIIRAAIPGLISRVLKDIANLTLPQIVIPPLDPTSASPLTGDVELDAAGVEIVGDGWCIPARLEF